MFRSPQAARMLICLTIVLGLLICPFFIGAAGGGKGKGKGGGGDTITNPAFVFSKSGGKLHLTTHDGSTTVALTKPKGQASDGAAAWSPDGLLIAFLRNPGDGGRDLYTINPDGSGQTLIVSLGPEDPLPKDNGGGSKLTLEWSPNASEIVYASQGTAIDPNGLYVVDLQATDPSPLCWLSGDVLGSARGGGPEDTFDSFGDPTLSPFYEDKGLLAFHAAFRDVDPDGGPDLAYIWDIWLVEVELVGGLLVADANSVVPLGGPGHREHPSFSPLTGNELAYTEDDGMGSYLVVMDMSNMSTRVVMLGYTREVTWSPDEIEMGVSAPRIVGQLQTTYDIFRFDSDPLNPPLAQPDDLFNVTNTDGQNEREVAPDWNPGWDRTP